MNDSQSPDAITSDADVVVATRRIAQADARVEPAFEPALVLRRDALEGSQFREAARIHREKAAEELRAAKAAAESILESARRDARAIVEEAQARASEHERSGFEAGRQEARARVEAVLAAIDHAERRRLEAFPTLVRDAALRFAQAIVDVEFTLHPEYVRELLATALENCEGKEVTVELSVNDHDLIGGEAAEIVSRAGAKFVRVRAVSDLGDRQVRIVATNGGRWTAGIDSALSDLRAHVERSARRTAETRP